MLTRNRSYNKPSGFKKPKKFIVVTEGHRENKYFEKFNSNESRISVLLVEMEADQSAPSHFIARLNKAQQDEEYYPQIGDEVWFVCDNDRGWRDHIEELKTVCEQQPNWNIAVSNPCFEVWLHLHSGPIDVTLNTCQELKTALPNTALGSFDADKYYPNIAEAANNARNADNSPGSFFPDIRQTKVYKLAESMLDVLGEDWK